MQLWEYRTEGADADLDALGAEGWELVSALPDGAGARLYLKRERSDPAARFTEEQKQAFLAGRGTDAGQAVGPPPLLNPEVAALVRRVRHTEMLLLADQGFPVPDVPLACDLSLCPGIPTILDVLETIEGHFHADRILLTEEMQAASPARVAELRERCPGLALEFHSHHVFKALARHARAAIRTGDPVPYANVILVSG